MDSTEYIYGINPVFETLRAGRRRIERAYVSTKGGDCSGRLRSLVAMLERERIPIERVDKGGLFRICESAEHQGIALRTSLYPFVSFESLLGAEKLLLLDNIEDPQNAGAVLRSAEVFGWNCVLMSSKGTPSIYPSVVKASAGATEHLRIARDHPANHYCRKLLAEGFSIIALDARGTERIRDAMMRMTGRPLLVVGGEHRSVGQFILNSAQHVIGIEQCGMIGSLNASVAAGIAMFELGIKGVKP